MDLETLDLELAAALEPLRFSPPVTHSYNPLVYAWQPHLAYLRRFGAASPREVVLVGMNPGPWGMAQTGVPFGDPLWVREWMGIEGEVAQPAHPHPKRPVLGLHSSRGEVSGSRIYGFAKERFGTAEAFFARFFILNYCPLTFMEASGRNRTPDKLPREERDPLFAACDRALAAKIAVLRPRYLVGIGAFAEACIRRVVDPLPPGVTVGRILHPSPASPAANQGWAQQAARELAALGVSLPPPGGG